MCDHVVYGRVLPNGRNYIYDPQTGRGTLLALTADEVVMDPNAVLGPVDPQIGDMPAAWRNHSDMWPAGSAMPRS